MGLATLSILDLQIELIEADDRNVYHLHKHGYEPSSIELWANLIKPGMTVLDVGAYTGIYSLIAAKRGAKVVAMEPMPPNRARMHINMLRNRVKIDIVNSAASDVMGTATLHHNRNVPLTTGASLEAGIAAHNAALIVKCITVDSLGLENVGAIKIDVERHEPCVLRGAMQTIERFRPPMLIETLDTGMREQILGMLPDYEAAAILDSRNTLFLPARSPTCHKAQSQEPPT